MSQNNNGMKNLGLLVGAVLVGVAIFAIVMIGLPKFGDNNGLEQVKEISYKEYNKMVDDKKDFMLVYGSEQCSACQAYLPIIDEVAAENKDVPIYYIDIIKLNSDERKELSTALGAESTPTTYIFVKGEKLSFFKVGKMNKVDTQSYVDLYKSTVE